MPQENAEDIYLKVRLGAGTLHLAKYLIQIAVYFSQQSYCFSRNLQMYIATSSVWWTIVNGAGNIRDQYHSILIPNSHQLTHLGLKTPHFDPSRESILVDMICSILDLHCLFFQIKTVNLQK